MTKQEAVEKVIALAEEQVGYVPYSGKRTKYADELDDTEDWYNGKKSGYDWCRSEEHTSELQSRI